MKYGDNPLSNIVSVETESEIKGKGNISDKYVLLEFCLGDFITHSHCKNDKKQFPDKMRMI